MFRLPEFLGRVLARLVWLWSHARPAKDAAHATGGTWIDRVATIGDGFAEQVEPLLVQIETSPRALRLMVTYVLRLITIILRDVPFHRDWGELSEDTNQRRSQVRQRFVVVIAATGMALKTADMISRWVTSGAWPDAGKRLVDPAFLQAVRSLREVLADPATVRDIRDVQARAVEAANAIDRLSYALTRSLTLYPPVRATAARARRAGASLTVLNAWAALLPATIANEDLGDYIEDINRRRTAGERWLIWFRTAAAIFWTALNAWEYARKRLRNR